MGEEEKETQGEINATLSGSDREVLDSINEKTEYLSDLFTRRLKDDRQKAELINALQEEAKFAYIEPFLHDLILVLDRLEKSEDDFSVSVYEELSDILFRRGVERIGVEDGFDPAVHKVVKTVEGDEDETSQIKEILRFGYTFNGRVIRPAEVILVKQEDREGRGHD